MTFVQLKYILTIAETKSLNKAAEQLYVSQPSLTNALKELEKEVGITIFFRTGRGVTLTNDGVEFLTYARELYREYEQLLQRYGEGGSYKKKFAVSTQHYSFAVKAFVDVAKKLDMSKYELAIRETKTIEVIQEVSTMKSEIGVLYLSEFNRKSMEKLFKSANLEFHPLISCKAYVYLWKGHPLADESFLQWSKLGKNSLTCLLNRVDNSSFILAEELLPTNEYSQIIHANDRATMLNLMIGLNGYTLCSGLICEELNGSDYRAVPFRNDGRFDDSQEENQMEIGYVTRKNLILSKLGQEYVTATATVSGIILRGCEKRIVPKKKKTKSL